ncbi:tryptophan--tRNA ligase [Methanosphaerula palustris]|uniref:tryptophan--tRNA ligase n=1 Tax=Methanosphaerula palustris (strain ATCC BAA-1556 / DSM 19958 / E1-9c) TaxID=521011 RepID=B8GEX6_METPE|nr:tryptophan--tRNA ligase [Methanosphaerula palustris]ACL15943.1 Tryptophan--tRNA ligase [Methanosphaerula palustris E1-9c]
MQPSINPWSSGQSIDTKKLFEEFGIEPIGPVLGDLPEIPTFMRRGVVIGHRDYGQIATAIREKRPFHVLTGFMPSGHPHLGHLMVMKEVVWHIRQGGQGTITIADCEAHAVRGLSWEDCDKYGREYLQCLYALGFEGRTYFQSRNEVLKNLAFEAATRVNFSDLSAIYGFGSETALAHAMSVINQVADILDPQVEGVPAPTVVPVGIDQDPHIRLTRDVARKLRFFTVEDRGDHVSVRSKNAPAAALEAVHRTYKGSKKYEGHVDIRGVPLEEVKERTRAVEIEHGGFGFFTPSATYHQFMPGLQGGKMSSSVPESIIGFHEPEAAVKKKVMGAVTGGRPTLEEQKAMGGEADRCPVYLLNLFHLIEDDRELQELRDRCCGGELTCGACKKETFARVSEFLHDFSERMDAVEHLVEV